MVFYGRVNKSFVCKEILEKTLNYTSELRHNDWFLDMKNFIENNCFSRGNESFYYTFNSFFIGSLTSYPYTIQKELVNLYCMKNIITKLLVSFLFLNTGLVGFVIASEINNDSSKNIDHSTYFEHSPQHHNQSSIDCIAHCLFSLDLNSYYQDNLS